MILITAANILLQFFPLILITTAFLKLNKK
jgi:hypothetical protein